MVLRLYSDLYGEKMEDIKPIAIPTFKPFADIQASSIFDGLDLSDFNYKDRLKTIFVWEEAEDFSITAEKKNSNVILFTLHSPELSIYDLVNSSTDIAKALVFHKSTSAEKLSLFQIRVQVDIDYSKHKTIGNLNGILDVQQTYRSTNYRSYDDELILEKGRKLVEEDCYPFFVYMVDGIEEESFKQDYFITENLKDIKFNSLADGKLDEAIKKIAYAKPSGYYTISTEIHCIDNPSASEKLEAEVLDDLHFKFTINMSDNDKDFDRLKQCEFVMNSLLSKINSLRSEETSNINWGTLFINIFTNTQDPSVGWYEYCQQIIEYHNVDSDKILRQHKLRELNPNDNYLEGLLVHWNIHN